MSEQNAKPLSEFIPDVPETTGFNKVVLELGVANHPGVMVSGVASGWVASVTGSSCSVSSA